MEPQLSPDIIRALALPDSPWQPTRVDRWAGIVPGFAPFLRTSRPLRDPARDAVEIRIEHRETGAERRAYFRHIFAADGRSLWSCEEHGFVVDDPTMDAALRAWSERAGFPVPDGERVLP